MSNDIIILQPKTFYAAVQQHRFCSTVQPRWRCDLRWSNALQKGCSKRAGNNAFFEQTLNNEPYFIEMPELSHRVIASDDTWIDVGVLLAVEQTMSGADAFF
nr:hypothetical protein [Evansella caseinilytica]